MTGMLRSVKTNWMGWASRMASASCPLAASKMVPMGGPATDATRLIIARIMAESSSIRMLGPAPPRPVVISVVMIVSSRPAAQARWRNTAGTTGSRPCVRPLRLSACAMKR